MENMQDSKKTVVLDPGSSRSVFVNEQVVHSAEMEQVLAIIRNLMKQRYKLAEENRCLKKSANLKFFEPDYRYPNNTILLSGTRGSGKTSFLYSLIYELSKNDNYDRYGKIEVLDIVDPTIVEEKAHVFLNIVARIKERVDQRLLKTKDDNAYRDWQMSLNKLAAGLPMLDGIGVGLDPSDWNDTTFVMHDGLKRVAGANSLKRDFEAYVAKSLKILGKDYFLIAFDDVDTDFAKGWPVLEILRKYLAIPQILTLLSGDLDLYGFLVRKKQWKNFGKTLLINEYDNKGSEAVGSEYTELVNMLENQYLMKLLRPEYRIMLGTLASKLSTTEVKVLSGDGKKEDLMTFYKESVKNAWGVQTDLQPVYARFFAELPLRTQVSLLSVFKESRCNSDYEDSNVRLHALSKGVADVFYSELHNAHVHMGEIRSGAALINAELLRFLMENRILDEGSQFFPKLNDRSLNGAVVALGALLTERLAGNPIVLFDHMIRLSNIVAKATKWPLTGTGSEPNIGHFVEYSRCMFNYGLQKTASLQTAYILTFDESRPTLEARLSSAVANGLIPIRALNSRSKERRDENDPAIDEVFGRNELSKITRLLGYLPALGVQNSWGRVNLYYSLFNILGAIGDMCLHSDENAVLNELVCMAQLREFPLFTTNANRTDENQEGAGDYAGFSVSVEGDAQVKKFVRDFMAWKSLWKKQCMLIPPYLIGRIMVRTTYSLQRIEVKSEMKAADLLHRQLVVFLNAVLVEECMELHQNAGLILANPTNSDANFVANYRRAMVYKDLNLFFFLWCSPLLRAYLDPKLIEVLDEYSEGMPGWHLEKEPSVFGMLSEMKILNNGYAAKRRNTFGLYSVLFDPEDAQHIAYLASHLERQGISRHQVKPTMLRTAIKELFANKTVNNEQLKLALDILKNSDR